jgi:glycerol-1-phosphate dehydrogenase [NAD(P)+]
MIAAGFGDMLGKYTALADWKLGRLLWDEPYSEAIAQRAWDALQGCVQRVTEIGAASPEGIRSLMAGLIETGLCMLDFGASPPASGAEHYLSHYWEMKLLEENRPAILHGAKVGVATILVARFYEKIKELTRQQAGEMLKATSMPDREQELQQIRTAYPAIADKVIAAQKPFLELTDLTYSLLKQKIVDQWPEIQEIAAIVPSSQQLTDLLRQVGGPVTTRELGLSDAEAGMAVGYTHYFRNRFTVMKLSHMLGIPLRL